MKPRKEDRCPHCVRLERMLTAEQARVDKYADMLARIVAQKAGVSETAQSWDAPSAPDPLPETVLRAIKKRAQPNEPLYAQLIGVARDMLAVGEGATAVERVILEGEPVEL